MLEILRKIGAATAAGQLFYVSQAEGLPLIQHNPALIAVDMAKVDPSDASKVSAILTEAGARMAAQADAPAAQAAPAAAQTAPASKPAILTGFVAPKLKRGGGGGAGAPTKYPFDGLEVGQFFFIADSAVEKGDAFKTLSSAVGSANQRYMEETGAVKEVERAKRGKDNKAIKGPDGKNVMEKVTLPVKRSLRKFIARKVEANVKYGDWTAPANGAAVQRVVIES